MTKRETFDLVKAHLLRQGCKSRGPDTRTPAEGRSDDGMMCLYRGPGGLKCAAGCLIPNDEYDPRIEGLRVTSEKVLPALRSHDLDLVERLQYLHDMSAVEDWPEGLDRIETGL